MVMTWHRYWHGAFGGSPPRPSSREESVQDVLAELFVGVRPPWFLPHTPTAGGKRLLHELHRAAFPDGSNADATWVVSEYQLPVPAEWRAEIGLTYGCPDFACAMGERIVILELKTERGSYRARQAADYLRLARSLHPKAPVDLVLLGPHRPGAKPPLQEAQRYAEMTWDQVPPMLREALPGCGLAGQLGRFIEDNFITPRSPETAVERSNPTEQVSDRIATAIDQALHIAPTLVARPAEPDSQRGIDVVFANEADARAAESHIRSALTAAGHERVTTWLWRGSSGGTPTTPSGRDSGMELRLAPRKGDKGDDNG
jgi:hypothetical protein